MVNAAVVRNSFDEIKVDKKPGSKFKRIDPVDAFVDAHALMLLNNADAANNVDLDDHISNYLKWMGWG